MISSVRIQNLRGIREGEITGLAPLSVVVGPNATGKSTVLDALLLGAHRYPAVAVGMAVERRAAVRLAVPWLFYRGGRAEPAVVRVSIAGRERETVLWWREDDSALAAGAARSGPRHVVTARIRQTASEATLQAQTWHAFFHASRLERYDADDALTLGAITDLRLVDLGDSGRGSLEQQYSAAVRAGREAAVNGALAAIMPGARLKILAAADESAELLCDSEHGIVPAEACGDGFLAMLRSVLALAASAGGVVLMEEPEAHQHPGSLHRLAREIAAAARHGIQVVLTTHSLDTLDFLLEQLPDAELDTLAVHRLRLSATGEMSCVRIAGSDAARARHVIGDDLR
jgi:predicted ATPase